MAGTLFRTLSSGDKLEGLEAKILGLCRILAVLLDLERPLSEVEAEDARRCRCIWVGSIFGTFAIRAKRESTIRQKLKKR